MPSALDTILQAGCQIAADSAEFANVGYYNYKATDATTNPSQVLTALSQPEYSYLADDAVQHVNEKLPDADPKERTELAMDYLLVQLGIEILGLIPGRVSISVDPRLAYNCDGIIRKARTLIRMFEESNIPRSRILLSIPASYPGIRAAQTLQSPSPSPSSPTSGDQKPIQTNLTLIFGLNQALACAKAKASVITLPMNQIKDWRSLGEPKRIRTSTDTNASDPFRDHHPSHAISLTRQIRTLFNTFGYKTQIMVSEFRHPAEVLGLVKEGRNGGPDSFVFRPATLHRLKVMQIPEEVKPENTLESTSRPEPRHPSHNRVEPSAEVERRFVHDLAMEQAALDKIPGALEKFVEDTSILEEKLKVQLTLSKMSSSPAMPKGWNVKYVDVKL